MRREGRRPVAARRRPESSGLYEPFPHSGNDNTKARQPARSSDKTCHPFILPGPAFLDSGLRRNDNGVCNEKDSNG